MNTKKKHKTKALKESKLKEYLKEYENRENQNIKNQEES